MLHHRNHLRQPHRTERQRLLDVSILFAQSHGYSSHIEEA
jgi:hypothetical protein